MQKTLTKDQEWMCHNLYKNHGHSVAENYAKLCLGINLKPCPIATPSYPVVRDINGVAIVEKGDRIYASKLVDRVVLTTPLGTFSTRSKGILRYAAVAISKQRTKVGCHNDKSIAIQIARKKLDRLGYIADRVEVYEVAS